MTRVFLIDEGVLVSAFEAYRSLTWTRRLHQVSTAELTIDSRLDNAELLEEGMTIGIADDPNSQTINLAFDVEDITRTATQDGHDTMVVNCVASGLIHVRRCLPPPYEPDVNGLFTDSHDETIGFTETFMKAIVDHNVGPGAPSWRQLPGLIIATDQNRGVSETYRARFDNLAEKLEKVGQIVELGWEVRPTVDNTLEFDVIEGVDRSDSIVFDFEFDSALEHEWERLKSATRTAVYAAGQGEGATREVRAILQGFPTGRLLRETFVDARDTESTEELEARGEEELAARFEEDTLTTAVFTQGPWRYRTDYDLGDLVRVRHRPWGVDVVKRIVEIEQTVEGDRGEPQLSVVTGKSRADLRQRMREEFEGRGTQRS